MSFEIIDNSKPKAPMYKYQPKPTFRTELERVKYWELQKERWINGYAGLTGAHYFYIQEITIKSETSGNYISPIWREVDSLIFGTIDKCLKNNKSLLVYKRREIGASVIFGGCLPNYFMRLYPGCTCLITSKDQPSIFKLFDDKTSVALDNMHPDLRPVVLNRNQTKNSVYLKLQMKTRGEDEEAHIRNSDLFCKETSETKESVNAFSGTRAKYAYLDEAGLHKRLEGLLKSVDACLKEGTKQTGFLAMAGTLEDSISNEGLYKLNKLFTESEFLNIETLFLPAWMGLNEFMVNGWDDEKKGTEWVQSEIERLDKLEDKSFVRAFRKNYPLSLNDIFDFLNTGRWEEGVAEKIKIQHKKIATDPPPVVVGKLVEMSSGMVFNPDSRHGKIHILENPKPNVDYYLCIDGVATGTKVGDEQGSEVAGTIVKMFEGINQLNYAPVSIYKERPQTVEASYINLSNLAKFYNKYGGLKGIMVEANAGTADHFSTFLKKNNLERYIMNKRDLSGKGHVNTKKAFQYVTVDVRDWLIRQANIYFRKYIENVKMILLLNDLIKPATANTDVLDSFLMFFIAAGDFDKPVKELKKPEYKEVPQIVYENGMTITKWVKIRIS